MNTTSISKKRLSPSVLKNMSDDKLAKIYYIYHKIHESDAIIDVLYHRHKTMIQRISNQIIYSRRNGMEREDCVSLACIAIHQSCCGFNSSKGESFKTFLYNNVKYTIMNYISSTAMVKTPSYLVGHRSYLRGDYDSDLIKKKKFEQDNGIIDEESRENFISTHKNLTFDFYFSSEIFNGDNTYERATENMISSVFDLDLTSDNQDIYQSIDMKCDLEYLELKMGDIQRRFFILYYKLNLSMNQICERMNQKMDYIKKIYHEVRSILRSYRNNLLIA